jgi:hypothetical protein
VGSADLTVDELGPSDKSDRRLTFVEGECVFDGAEAGTTV